jgi:hypothetical protein
MCRERHFLILQGFSLEAQPREMTQVKGAEDVAFLTHTERTCRTLGSNDRLLSPYSASLNHKCCARFNIFFFFCGTEV